MDQPIDNQLDVVEEAPSVMTVKQQQAGQMKVYWRVCVGSPLSCAGLTEISAVH